MKNMDARPLKVSVLYGTGIPDPDYREVLLSMGNLKQLKEALDLETFWAQHREQVPDLLLVDLDGAGVVPDWLNPLISRLPQTEVMVCSHSRDVDFLLRVMKCRAGGFLPLPLKREEVTAMLERIQSQPGRPHGHGESQILAVTGTKGGVGATSVATNLAVALAEIMPGEVVLVDLARPFPHVVQFLDLKPEHTVKDLITGADNLDPIFLKKIIQKHKTNLDVLPSIPEYNLNSQAPPDMGAMCKIFTALRTSYTYVVVDLGSWVDLFYIRVLQKADQILLVTELTLPDLQNSKVIKALFLEWGLHDHKVKILVNHYAKHYALGLKNLANIFSESSLYTFPHDYSPLMEAINQGEPLGEMTPRAKLWRKIKELASELVAQNQPQDEIQLASGTGLLRKIFSR